MHEVVTLGECMALLCPEEPVTLEQAKTFSLDIAGAESNVAIGLSRLGHSVQFISRVGDDPFGRRIRATLDAEGVDTSCLLIDQVAPTGVFFREWLADGVRRVFYYRNGSAASHLVPEDAQPESFTGARILHVTGITPALSESCAATVKHAIELAHAAGCLVSLDPNYRAKLWDAPIARKTLLPLMAHADVLLLGHEDASALFETDDDERILEQGARFGAQVVVLKRAERGACAWTQTTRGEVPAEVVAAAIDPVGAGDGFDAGFLAGWLRGDSLDTALRLGAYIGAQAVATRGDYAGYPRLAHRRNYDSLKQ